MSLQLQATTRRRGGRGPDGTLYSSRGAVMGLLRDVATAANLYRPHETTMAVWNRARAAGGHPNAPSAESLHQRLNRKARQRVSWRRLLEIACATHADPAQVGIAAFSEGKAKHLGDSHVAFALGLVAQEFEGRSFPEDAYDHEREKLIANARRRLGNANALEEVLPTGAQVTRIAGTWEKGLALAGLPPFAAQKQTVFRRRNSMPVVEAVLLFVELNGRFPSYPVCSAWARDANISLAMPRTKGGWWSQVLDDATATLKDSGLQVPTERPRAGRPGKDEDRSYVLPDEPVDAAGQGSTYWTPELIVSALRTWLRTLPSGVVADEPRYRTAQRERADEWPSTGTVIRHGGWAMLRDIAEERNRRVDEGHPDDFQPLPATLHAGHLAREAARAIRTQHGPGHRKNDHGARIRVLDLMNAGFLTAGERLTGRYKNTDYVATVETDGQLEVVPFAVESRGGDPVISGRLRA